MQTITISHIVLTTFVNPLVIKFHENLVGYRKLVWIVQIVWFVEINTFIYTIWQKRGPLKKVFAKVQEIENLMQDSLITGILPSRKTITLVTWILSGAFILIACADMLFIDIEIQNCESLYTGIVVHQIQDHQLILKYFDPKSLTTLPLIVLGALVCSWSNVLTHYVNCSAVVYTIMLYWLTQGSIRSIQQNPQFKNFDQIVKLLNTLMDLSDLYEDSLGLMFTCYCLVLLPLHSFKFKMALSDGDNLRLCATCLHIVVWLSFIFISAQTNHLLKSVIPIVRNLPSCTISANLDEKIELQQKLSRASMLVNAISGNSFGIRGIGFTITYGLIGNIASLMVTCIVVIYQIW
ncbi:unnamed protein product [Allacma fusca]|uniref:Uncharacterized protein n=1 Tax=Allacma fusca TaxID=39272 RepID=A0A8J2LDH9_9HEXA|nr:unnamed protein product [Allacma fusca]